MIYYIFLWVYFLSFARVNIKRFSILLIFTGLLLPFSYTYADERIDAAWWLGRILKLDHTIRTSTGKTLTQKKQRGIILKNNQRSIANLIETWNYIPTTDRTLDYTLTLQKYKLSCEIAAMKAVYGALGYARTEDQIIATLPFHNKPFNESTGTWWDPDKEFVGLIDGSQNKKTWYGIYEVAIEKNFHNELGKYLPGLKTEAWNEFTRPREYSDETHLTHLLTTLDNGWHVIIWWDWCTDPSYEDGILGRDKWLIMKLFPIPGKNICKSWHINRDFNWKTAEGKEVVAFNGDHVFVLLGYIGKKTSPSHIIVWDTDTGRHIYPTSEWMRKWWHIENRSLVIKK
jgi:Peptidase_C39 like family